MKILDNLVVIEQGIHFGVECVLDAIDWCFLTANVIMYRKKLALHTVNKTPARAFLFQMKSFQAIQVDTLQNLIFYTNAEYSNRMNLCVGILRG